MPREQSDSPVQVDQELELEIEGLSANGEGMAHFEGYLVFVRAALPSERVLAKIRSTGRRYARADAIQVITAADHRVPAPCPHFAYCGGCDLQHLAYEKQIEFKTEQMRSHFQERLNAPQLKIEEALHPESPWEQRSKLTLHLHKKGGKLKLGLFQPYSRRVFGMESCPVLQPIAQDALRRVKAGLAKAGLSIWKPGSDGQLKSVILRSSQSAERAHVVLVTSTSSLPGIDKLHAELEDQEAIGLSLHVHQGSDTLDLNGQNYHLRGPTRLEEEIAGIRYLFSPTAFFQTSPWGAARLVDLVRTLCTAQADARVVDLYCGGGLLSLALAGQVGEVIGIEIDPVAVADAKASADLNATKNVSFRHGAAEQLERDFKFIQKPHSVVLDPPRSGCDPRVLPAIASELAPEEIIYVSCNPTTLANDLVLLRENGYALRSLHPLDMFPHTQHMEAVAALDRMS